MKQLELEKENFEKEEILREKRKLEAEQIAKEDAERKKVTITRYKLHQKDQKK